jgi:hypothetical protein
MRSFRDILRESIVTNLVGLFVGTILGGGAMFVLQRHITVRDEARKEVLSDVLPRLEKFRHAISPLDWDIMMSLDDRERSQRFMSVVEATVASWDSLGDSSELIGARMRMSFDAATANDFQKLVEDLGKFRDQVAEAGSDKRIGKKVILLADTSSSYVYFADLAGDGDILQTKILEFEIRLLSDTMR